MPRRACFRGRLAPAALWARAAAAMDSARRAAGAAAAVASGAGGGAGEAAGVRPGYAQAVRERRFGAFPVTYDVTRIDPYAEVPPRAASPAPLRASRARTRPPPHSARRARTAPLAARANPPRAARLYATRPALQQACRRSDAVRREWGTGDGGGGRGRGTGVQIFADPANRQMRAEALARWTGSDTGRAEPASGPEEAGAGHVSCV